MKHQDRMYKPEELEKTQLIMRDALIEVLRICEKHNIKISLDSGTMLGAIRHSGFIPWDDDIDLGMLREDYEKFLSVLPEELDEKFEFDNWYKTKDFPAPNTTVWAKGTVSIPIEMKGCTYRYGVGLGVYPYDNLSDEPKIARKQQIMCFVLGKLNWLKMMPFPYIPHKGIMRFIIHSICAVVHVILKLVPRRFITEAFDKYSMLCKEKTEKVFLPAEGGIGTTTTARTGFENMVKTSFEDVDSYIIGNYEEWLTNVYGDYMQLPPPDKRKNHFPCELSFGEYEFNDYKLKYLQEEKS